MHFALTKGLDISGLGKKNIVMYDLDENFDTNFSSLENVVKDVYSFVIAGKKYFEFAYPGYVYILAGKSKNADINFDILVNEELINNVIDFLERSGKRFFRRKVRI